MWKERLDAGLVASTAIYWLSGLLACQRRPNGIHPASEAGLETVVAIASATCDGRRTSRRTSNSPINAGSSIDGPGPISSLLHAFLWRNRLRRRAGRGNGCRGGTLRLLVFGFLFPFRNYCWSWCAAWSCRTCCSRNWCSSCCGYRLRGGGGLCVFCCWHWCSRCCNRDGSLNEEPFDTRLVLPFFLVTWLS